MLNRITDKHSNTIDISRIGGAISRIATTSGEGLGVDSRYAATAMVGAVKDRLGRTWSYAYDGGSRLTQITYPRFEQRALHL
ncbi:MAG: RHS repeat protein [Brachymonas sp.]|nr:RHS repeat protein [Brachymonas sp.]